MRPHPPAPVAETKRLYDALLTGDTAKIDQELDTCGIEHPALLITTQHGNRCVNIAAFASLFCPIETIRDIYYRKEIGSSEQEPISPLLGPNWADITARPACLAALQFDQAILNFTQHHDPRVLTLYTFDGSLRRIVHEGYAAVQMLYAGNRQRNRQDPADRQEIEEETQFLAEYLKLLDTEKKYATITEFLLGRSGDEWSIGPLHIHPTTVSLYPHLRGIIPPTLEQIDEGKETTSGKKVNQWLTQLARKYIEQNMGSLRPKGYGSTAMFP